MVASIQVCLQRNLGNNASATLRWLDEFAFTDEASQPEIYYWERRFRDLLAIAPAPPPSTLDSKMWSDLILAFRGAPPLVASRPWSSSFAKAAEAVIQQRRVMEAIEKAREKQLTEHDLAVYVHFGWNDDGNLRGLTSLEVGTRLQTTLLFWQSVSKHIPAEPIEELALARDRELWRGSLHAIPSDYGTESQTMADLFPEPQEPPKLQKLLERIDIK